MDKSIRVVLLLLGLIVIPFIIYAFLQLNSLNEDEKMASDIYKKQMETVLFSLNQYADDMMDQWVRRLSNEQYPMAQNAYDLVLGNESIQMLVLRKMDTKQDSLFLNEYVESTITAPQEIKTWYQNKDSVLTQLTKYLDAGFQKIQAADDWKPITGLKPAQNGITVMTYDKDSILYNALFVFEANYWAEQLIGPKMQELGENDFNLAVLQQAGELEATNVIYNTEGFNLEKEYIQNILWIMPNTYLSIQSKGRNFSELIKERSRKNLLILFFAMLTVLIAAYVMLRNIRNALKIAQLKSDFVSNVSHEIRTPLSLIKMYSETLMMDRLPSEKKKQHYYKVIHHESGRLTYLVNNILDFSRIEANQKSYQKVDANINDLVERLHSNYSYSFQEKNIISKLALNTEAIHIKVDLLAFEEALSNLLENAIKYSEQEKLIKITTYIEKEYGCCSVTDKGIGIPKRAQEHIFDKFYRVEDALTQKTKGTGLGLSLVKHIMKSHLGEVTVSSIPNEGSTFVLKFPLSQ